MKVSNIWSKSIRWMTCFIAFCPFQGAAPVVRLSEGEGEGLDPGGGADLQPALARVVVVGEAVEGGGAVDLDGLGLLAVEEDGDAALAGEDEVGVLGAVGDREPGVVAGGELLVGGGPGPVEGEPVQRDGRREAVGGRPAEREGVPV
ncbi:hypothetical protein GCM10020254_07460 [Streptomyces goshikiensis]